MLHISDCNRAERINTDAFEKHLASVGLDREWLPASALPLTGRAGGERHMAPHNTVSGCTATARASVLAPERHHCNRGWKQAGLPHLSLPPSQCVSLRPGVSCMLDTPKPRHSGEAARCSITSYCIQSISQAMQFFLTSHYCKHACFSC